MSVATARSEATEASVELHRLLRDSAATFAKRGGIARVRALRAKTPGSTAQSGRRWPSKAGSASSFRKILAARGSALAEMAVVVEELSRLLAPEPLIGGAVLAAKLIEGGSNDQLKATMLPKIASGETIIGAGLTGRFGALDAAASASSATARAPTPAQRRRAACRSRPGRR